MISRTIWRKKENIPSALISTGKIFKDQNCTGATGWRDFVVFEKYTSAYQHQIAAAIMSLPIRDVIRHTIN